MRKSLRTRRYPMRLAVYGGLFVLIALLFLYWRHLKNRKPENILPQKQIVVSAGALSETPLYNVLTGLGLSGTEAGKISLALKKVINPRKLQEGDGYAVVLSTSGEFHYLTVVHLLKNYSVFRVQKTGGYTASIRKMPLDAARRSDSGKISGSLWESMNAAGINPQVIMQFADIFAWNIDFLTEVRNGDSWSLIWQEETVPGMLPAQRYGYSGPPEAEHHGQPQTPASYRNTTVVGINVLAAAYDGAMTGKKKGVFFENDYYTEKGKSLRGFFLRAPLQYRRISSYFSKKRFHPILRIFRPHLGIDYAAPAGTPVSAVASGAVSFIGWKGGFGRYLEIRHSNGYVSTYGHLNRYAKGIKKGTSITQGKVIAYVGSTGISTGSHLDFRIKQNGKHVNFLKIKGRSAGGLGGRRLSAFKTASAPIVSELEKLHETP
ncbi:MAG: M23 family metallopeptidase [bacterium]